MKNQWINFSAFGIGALAGSLGALFWFLTKIISEQGLNDLSGKAYFIPLGLSVFLVIIKIILKRFYVRKNTVERRQPIGDIFESYYFGLFIGEYLRWLSRGFVSLVSFLFLGITGIEGAVLDFVYFSLPLTSKALGLFLEEKQVLVICAISSSLSVSFGAPFSGTLIALEMIQVAEGKLRASAVVSALVSQGIALLFIGDMEMDRFQFFPSLFSGLQTSTYDLQMWIKIALAAAALGFVIGIFSFLYNRVLIRGNEFFGQIFGAKIPLRVLITGCLLALSIYLSPEIFSLFPQAGKMGSDLSWLHLSGNTVVVAWLLYVGMTVLAFAGWGVSGLFTPMLILGAFIGYLYGNVLTSILSVPVTVQMTILGAATLLGVGFGAPVAATALVFEVGRNGSLWWLSVFSIGAGTLVLKLIKEEPLHVKLLERSGLRVVEGKIANILSKMNNQDAMIRDFLSLKEDSTFEELKTAVHSTEHHFLGVHSHAGNFIGTIALEKLPRKVRSCLNKVAPQHEISALERVYDIKTLMDPYFPRVGPVESLEKSLLLLKYNPCLVVVDETGKMLGILYETAVLSRYKNELTGVSVRKF